MFPEIFRDTGGATLLVDVLGSALGIGESLRVERADGTRPPPEPVLLIDSPPVSDTLPGTGDGAADLAAPTLRIWART